LLHYRRDLFFSLVCITSGGEYFTMSFLNLNHFCRNRDGRFERRRWRALKEIGVLTILLALPAPSFAQSANWGKWVEPALGSDKGIPPGVAYPGGQPLCEGMKLSGKHAYWRCMNRCDGQTGGYCWEGVSDDIYTCPDGKGFRRMEKIRYTSIPCGPKDWKITKHLAEIYEETWQKDIPDPPEITTASTPPTTEAELPPTTGDTPPTWDGGGPPWAPKEAEKTDSKTDTAKTDTAKTDTGKTETDKKDAATEKKVTGGASTTPPSGKKAPKKEVRKAGKTIARNRSNEGGQDGGGLSPEAATAIGIGIGMGLGGGFGGRGRMDRMDRRMDR
jgi:hypothetical protein